MYSLKNIEMKVSNSLKKPGTVTGFQIDKYG